MEESHMRFDVTNDGVGRRGVAVGTRHRSLAFPGWIVLISAVLQPGSYVDTVTPRNFCPPNPQ